MKASITSGAMILAMSLSIGAMGAAADGGNKHDRQYKQSDRYEERDYKRDRKRHDRRRHRAETVRLNVPLRIHGSKEIRLSRILSYHHGIDTNRYTLKKVVLHNGAAYPKSRARVYVGRQSSGKYLHDGANHIEAPAGYGDRWTVRVKHAHLNRMTVVLEPKPRYVGHRPNRYKRNSWRWASR